MSQNRSYIGVKERMNTAGVGSSPPSTPEPTDRMTECRNRSYGWKWEDMKRGGVGGWGGEVYVHHEIGGSQC
jgi:hypothetical protein